MGACFQAPHAAPGQRLMENAPCSLILLLYLQYASHDKSHGYVQIISDNNNKTTMILVSNNNM